MTKSRHREIGGISLSSVIIIGEILEGKVISRGAMPLHAPRGYGPRHASLNAQPPTQCATYIDQSTRVRNNVRRL